MLAVEKELAPCRLRLAKDGLQVRRRLGSNGNADLLEIEIKNLQEG